MDQSEAWKTLGWRGPNPACCLFFCDLRAKNSCHLFLGVERKIFPDTWQLYETSISVSITQGVSWGQPHPCDWCTVSFCTAPQPWVIAAWSAKPFVVWCKTYWKKKTGPPLNWRVAPVWVERGEKEEGQQLTLGKGHQMWLEGHQGPRERERSRCHREQGERRRLWHGSVSVVFENEMGRW